MGGAAFVVMAACESQKNATVPPDVVAALADNQQAKDFFDSLARRISTASTCPFCRHEARRRGRPAC